MDFRLLGLVEAAGDAHTLVLGGAKQRLVGRRAAGRLTRSPTPAVP
jgi:hypothetical protein